MNFYAINQVLLDRLMVGPRFLEPLIGVRVPVEQQIFCYNKNIHMANLPFTPITTLELCLGIGAFIIITALFFCLLIAIYNRTRLVLKYTANLIS